MNHAVRVIYETKANVCKTEADGADLNNYFVLDQQNRPRRFTIRSLNIKDNSPAQSNLVTRSINLFNPGGNDG